MASTSGSADHNRESVGQEEEAVMPSPNLRSELLKAVKESIRTSCTDPETDSDTEDYSHTNLNCNEMGTCSNREEASSHTNGAPPSAALGKETDSQGGQPHENTQSGSQCEHVRAGLAPAGISLQGNCTSGGSRADECCQESDGIYEKEAKEKELQDPSGTPKVCRICFEGEDETNEVLLENVCGCSGSMAYLHKSCLNKWISESRTLTCEICKQPFKLTQEESNNWLTTFAREEEQRRPFALGIQQEAQTENLMLNNIQNRFLRSCMQRTWRNRGALNSGVIVLIGSSILVMMSLVVYHFLSPTQEEVIAGQLPSSQNPQEPFNCSVQADTDRSAVGWLCGVPAHRIYKGDCGDSSHEDQPCGIWNNFQLLQSDLPGCFFGHGSICYVALQPKEDSGGVCKNQACIPFNSTNIELLSPAVQNMARGLLTQGKCVACV